MHPSLANLARIDHEILRQDRPVKPSPDGSQIFQRPAEEWAVGQYADCVRDRRIGLYSCSHADSTSVTRRRPLLHLHDEASIRPREGFAQAAARRWGVQARFCQASCDIASLAIDDFGEDAFNHG